MIRRTTLCLTVAALIGLSSQAGAQGRAPAGAGHSTPAMSQAEIRNRVAAADARRQDAARRAEAEARRAEAQRRRAEAEAHNNSDEARAAHPPDEHAADNATLAEQNADRRERRERRPRRDRG
jgi:hypothetical protein